MQRAIFLHQVRHTIDFFQSHGTVVQSQPVSAGGDGKYANTDAQQHIPQQTPLFHPAHFADDQHHQQQGKSAAEVRKTIGYLGHRQGITDGQKEISAVRQGYTTKQRQKHPVFLLGKENVGSKQQCGQQSQDAVYNGKIAVTHGLLPLPFPVRFLCKGNMSIIQDKKGKSNVIFLRPL